VSKALPQRCQFRSFGDICAQYCIQDRAFAAWLRKVVVASVVGVYPHCHRDRADDGDTTPPWHATYVRALFTTPQGAWATWVRHHPWFVFYAVKEHLIAVLPLEPALYQVVCRVYRWHAFEHTVVRAMNVARSVVASNQRRHKPPFVHTDVELARCHTQYVRHLLRLPSVSETTFVRMAVRAPPLRLLDPATVSAIQHVVLYRRQCPATRSVSHATWVTVLADGDQDAGTLWWALVTRYRSRTVATTTASAGTVAAPWVARMAPRTVAVVAAYATALERLAAVHLWPLPAHTYRAHRTTLARSVHPDGVYYVCRVCHQFKGFVVRPPPHHGMAGALGYDKVLYDDTTGQVFCARRPPRGPPGCGRRVSQCATTPLVPVRMTGRVLACYGRLYLLCVRCGRPCPFEFGRYRMGTGTPYVDGICCVECDQQANGGGSGGSGGGGGGGGADANHVRPRPVRCVYCDRAAPRSRRGWLAVTLTCGTSAWLCARHAIASVRHVPQTWDVEALRALVASTLEACPPNTRRRRRSGRPLKRPRR